MKKTCIILFMAVFFFGFTNFVKAQTAQDFFHPSAQQYINGNFETCGQTLAEGLAKYPNDVDLNALAELLKKKKEEQKQKQQQQARKDKEKKEQDKKKEQQKQPADKNKMNKKEADQILQALRENEKEAQKKKAPIKADGRYVEKDW